MEGHCELCGNFSSKLGNYVVENAHMQVCPDCGKFGSREKSNAQLRAIHAKINSPEFKKRIKDFVRAEKDKYANRFSLESGERVIDNYSEIIRKIVQTNQWTNEQFAKKVNEKESYISQILSGHLRPSIELAKKIEKMFNVVLIEVFDLKSSGNLASVKSKEQILSDGLTIGDIIKNSRIKK